eukprot:222580_1
MNNMNNTLQTTASNNNNSERKGVHPLLQRVRVCRHYLTKSQCSLGRSCNFLHLKLGRKKADDLEAEARKRIGLNRLYNEAVQYYLINLYSVPAVDALPDYEAFDAAIKVLEDGGAAAVALTQKADAHWAKKGEQLRIRNQTKRPLLLASESSPAPGPMAPVRTAPAKSKAAPWSSDGISECRSDELSTEMLSDTLSTTGQASDNTADELPEISDNTDELPEINFRTEVPPMIPMPSFYHPMEMMSPEMMCHPDMMPMQSIPMQRVDSSFMAPMQRTPMMPMPSLPMQGHMHGYPMWTYPQIPQDDYSGMMRLDSMMQQQQRMDSSRTMTQ